METAAGATAAGAMVGLVEGMLGTFPFGLAVCFKFEGRGRGNGGATGRVECVSESMAEGGGDVLKTPSFGLLGGPPMLTGVAWSGGTSRSGGSIVAVAGGGLLGDVLCGGGALLTTLSRFEKTTRLTVVIAPLRASTTTRI
jgi:hypothetical protein